MTEHASERKLLGAFYTEGETADAIARLAVLRASDTVLDPSFGGCAFLEAVRARLSALGAAEPMRRVYGVDVDPKALEFLKGVRGARSRQFLMRDFLAISPEDFRIDFDVVVGNPPFIRHHLLSSDSVALARSRFAQDVRIPRTADAWLYFLHHSLRFLRRGGCLALVLPGAFLNATYASSAREKIASTFASCDLFLVRRRLFADALESPVIVVARGYRDGPARCRLRVVDSAKDIDAAYHDSAGTEVDLTEKNGPWRLSLLSDASRAALSFATYSDQVRQLGSTARVLIGVVTGANHFFTLRDSDVREHTLPSSMLRPILTSSKQFQGLSLRRQHLKELQAADERVWLLDTSRSKRYGACAIRYLTSERAAEAQRAFKCRDRDVWHQLRDLTVPEGFLSYVSDRAPRLVLNDANLLCTNAIHRVWWRKGASANDKKACALSVLSSLGALSAELYGRSTGGGALKLEPNEAAALWVVCRARKSVDIARAFQAASRAASEGDWERAQAIADRAILEEHLGLDAERVTALRVGHETLRALRFSIAARFKPRLA